MKNLVIILTILFSLCWQAVGAQARTGCNGLKVKPEIHISTSYGQLSYDFSRSTKQISRIAASTGHKENSFFATGLATIVIKAEYEVGTKAHPLENQAGYCVVPKVINIFVGFTKPRIYVSKELEENSCQYNLVLLHERTHQRINKSTLDYFLPLFKQAAGEISQNIKPRKISNGKQMTRATNEITQEFSDQFEKVVNVFKKELAIEQGKLDNSINYSMEDNICRQFNQQQRQFQGRFHRGNH